MAKQKRSLTDRVNTTPSPTTTTTTTTEMTAEAQEQALQKLQSQSKPTKKKVRVSVDFPIELYERMKEDTDANGQTHRGFEIKTTFRSVYVIETVSKVISGPNRN